MQIQLSVLIITFNEERNIGRCLESVKNVADEIVVVDSFSTDGTRAICEKYDVRFIEHTFDGHVEQKNWAMGQANYMHILSLDADEALSPELESSILKVKENWSHEGYSMNRLTNYCGKWIYHSGWYPDRKLRLINKEKGQWGGMNPHDKLQIEKSLPTKRLQGDLLHYSFYTIDEHKKQIHYFSDIASKSLLKNGKKASILDLWVHPIAKFIKGYFIKGGILDGKYGFIICRLSAYSNYLKYKKLMALQKSQ